MSANPIPATPGKYLTTELRLGCPAAFQRSAGKEIQRCNKLCSVALVASLLLVVRPGAPFVASLLLVAMPGSPSSFLLLVTSPLLLLLLLLLLQVLRLRRLLLLLRLRRLRRLRLRRLRRRRRDALVTIVAMPGATCVASLLRS